MTKHAVLIDYGVGNIRSVIRVLESCVSSTGENVVAKVTNLPEQIASADLIMLPGVGAFNAASEQLEQYSDLIRTRVLEEGTPLIGVCLGMQLLFEKSEEGDGNGLGIFDGSVTKLTSKRVPHMGWNKISYSGQASGPEWAYFAHSFACRPEDETVISGRTTYEDDTFPSIVRTQNVLATQFHPEKSDLSGVALIEDFIKEVL